MATENDTVYALAADTGAVLWSTHVGTPVPVASTIGACGDISPTVGITGTPVIDSARGEIFAVADELVGGAPAHFLVGLNMYDGTVELDQAVDPPDPGVNPPVHLLQRTGLNLDDGNVVFGFGGNYATASPITAGSSRCPRVAARPAYYDTTGSTPNGTRRCRLDGRGGARGRRGR